MHWNLAKVHGSNTKVKRNFHKQKYFSSYFSFQELIPGISVALTAQLDCKDQCWNQMEAPKVRLRLFFDPFFLKVFSFVLVSFQVEPATADDERGQEMVHEA
jgi:hypothetical protein